MPGRRESSVARSSMADKGDRELGTGNRGSSEARFPVPRSLFPLSLERKFERQIHSPGELAHLLLRQVARLLLGLDDSDEDEILEHLDVRRIHDGRVDLDLANLTFAIGLDRDHSTAGRSVDSPGFKLILDLLQSTLHL